MSLQQAQYVPDLSSDPWRLFLAQFYGGYRMPGNPKFYIAVPGIETDRLEAIVCDSNPDKLISGVDGLPLAKKYGQIEMPIDLDKCDDYMLRRVFSATIYRQIVLSMASKESESEKSGKALDRLMDICLRRLSGISEAQKISSPLYVAQLLHEASQKTGVPASQKIRNNADAMLEEIFENYRPHLMDQVRRITQFAIHSLLQRVA